MDNLNVLEMSLKIDEIARDISSIEHKCECTDTSLSLLRLEIKLRRWWQEMNLEHN